MARDHETKPNTGKDEMKILALVTAKSTSSRIAFKNKAVIHGKPLYKWTTDFIENHYDFFEDFVFSTDNIGAFNVQWLNIKRGEYLIADTTPHLFSVVHALNKCEKVFQKTYDMVYLFQPTNPIRNEKLLYHAAAVSEYHKDHSKPFRANCLYVDDNLPKKYIHGAWFGKKAGNAIIRSGLLYVYNRAYLVGDELTHMDTPEIHMMVPKEFGYNIDVPMDIRIVETFMKELGVPYGYQTQRI